LEEVLPADLNNDGIVTIDEKRKYYEEIGWKDAYQNKSYFHHPWFDWNKTERWIGDPHAVEFWEKYRGGSDAQLSQIKKSNYPTDFTKKIY